MLGIAWRPVALDHPHAVLDDETELIFAGFAAYLAANLIGRKEAITTSAISKSEADSVARNFFPAWSVASRYLRLHCDLELTNERGIQNVKGTSLIFHTDSVGQAAILSARCLHLNREFRSNERCIARREIPGFRASERHHAIVDGNWRDGKRQRQ